MQLFKSCVGVVKAGFDRIYFGQTLGNDKSGRGQNLSTMSVKSFRLSGYTPAIQSVNFT